MAFPAMIMDAAGGAVGAFGSIFSGEAQKNMYTYQAGVAEANAKIFEQNKNIAYDVGERQAQLSGMRTAQTVGHERAGAGAGNLAPSTGSPAQVQASQISAGRLEQQNIRFNAAQGAYSENIKAFGATAIAGLERTAATTAMESGEIGAVSSILGGSASVADKWQQASIQAGQPGASSSSVWWGA